MYFNAREYTILQIKSRISANHARCANRAVYQEPPMISKDIKYNNIIDGEEARRAQKAADDSDGLDHTKIDTESFYVTQHYDRYNEEDHRVWKMMWEKRWDVLEEQASKTYLAGLRAINLNPELIGPALNIVLTKWWMGLRVYAFCAIL